MAYSNPTGLPSVTDILRPFIDTEWFTEEHAARGTAVHDAAHCYAQGLFVPTLQPHYRPYYDSFQLWFDESIEEVFATEERLVDEALGFCGQYDIIARIKGDPEGTRTLIDYKTSQTKYPWWRLQSAAYQHLVEQHMTIHRRLSVRIKRDGSGCLIDEYTGGTGDFNTFLAALTCYNFFH